jgi:hypothetical protein
MRRLTSQPVVSTASAPFAASHLGARLNGGLPVARVHSPEKVVNAGTVPPREVQPATFPYFTQTFDEIMLPPNTHVLGTPPIVKADFRRAAPVSGSLRQRQAGREIRLQRPPPIAARYGG